MAGEEIGELVIVEAMRGVGPRRELCSCDLARGEEGHCCCVGFELLRLCGRVPLRFGWWFRCEGLDEERPVFCCFAFHGEGALEAVGAGLSVSKVDGGDVVVDEEEAAGFACWWCRHWCAGW